MPKFARGGFYTIHIPGASDLIQEKPLNWEFQKNIVYCPWGYTMNPAREEASSHGHPGTREMGSNAVETGAC